MNKYDYISIEIVIRVWQISNRLNKSDFEHWPEIKEQITADVFYNK